MDAAGFAFGKDPGIKSGHDNRISGEVEAPGGDANGGTCEEMLFVTEHGGETTCWTCLK